MADEAPRWWRCDKARAPRRGAILWGSGGRLRVVVTLNDRLRQPRARAPWAGGYAAPRTLIGCDRLRDGIEPAAPATERVGDTGRDLALWVAALREGALVILGETSRF